MAHKTLFTDTLEEQLIAGELYDLEVSVVAKSSGRHIPQTWSAPEEWPEWTATATVTQITLRGADGTDTVVETVPDPAALARIVADYEQDSSRWGGVL